MEQFNQVIETLNNHTKNVPGIKDVAAAAGVTAGHVTLGLLGLLTGFMLFGFGADLITDVIGMFYPMYMSFKALESKGGDDDKLWLTYWVVFAVWKVLDEWVYFLFSWIPCYFTVKLGILIFLFHPQYKGAVLIYDSLIRPWVLKHQKDIESSITKMGEVASAATQLAKEEALKKGTDYIISSHSSK